MVVKHRFFEKVEVIEMSLCFITILLEICLNPRGHDDNRALLGPNKFGAKVPTRRNLL